MRGQATKKNEGDAEEDSDDAGDENDKVEVGGEEDLRDVAAIDAEDSEAEELRFMQRVRDLRRTDPKQHKYRPRNFVFSKFTPVPVNADIGVEQVVRVVQAAVEEVAPNLSCGGFI